MPHIRTSLLTAAVAGAVLAPAATAQAAPTTFAPELAPTRVAAWEGTVMWSHFDPATKTYSLVKSVDGAAPAAVNVPPRSGGPFDLDLGTDRNGNTIAVYTRDGDVYRLNVASGPELRIKNVSTTSVERDPTIQDGRLAFIRRVGGNDELRLGAITGRSRGRTVLVRKRKIVSAELGAKHIVYLTTGPGPISDEGTTFVRIRNLSSGADRQIYKAVSGGANAANVTRPTYVAKPAGFFWARTNVGSGSGNRFVRYTLRGSTFDYAKGSPFYNSTAWAGSALGAITASALQETTCTDVNVNYCKVDLTGPLSFDAAP